tara:strand:- start:7969 stop:8634 length:666 start_codon:yes stop_codon:yes gene_type:complete
MIVITGASSGLGAELARVYDAQGLDLFLTGRSEQKLANVLQNIKADTKHQTCDLANAADVSSLFDQVDETPTTIIHCAGSGYFGLLQAQQPEAIEQLIQNNLTSAINVVRESVKRYQDKPVNLVIIMSTAAQQPKAQESTYCAVKWAVKGFVESVRLELKGKPMKLIAVYPGGMATDFWPTSGKALDTENFIDAKDAAEMISGALTNLGNGYVSDITVNRG